MVGHLPEFCGDVRVSGGAELVDREAAEGGHVLRAVAGVDLGGVLAKVVSRTKRSRFSTVTVPTDGVARSYCWSGVPTNTTMRFNYASTNNAGGDIAFASGSGRVR